MTADSAGTARQQLAMTMLGVGESEWEKLPDSVRESAFRWADRVLDLAETSVAFQAHVIRHAGLRAVTRRLRDELTELVAFDGEWIGCDVEDGECRTHLHCSLAEARAVLAEVAALATLDLDIRHEEGNDDE